MQLRRSLVAYDINFKNTADDFIIDESNELRVNDYLGDRAHLAALAFSKTSGLRLGIFLERMAPDTSEPAIKTKIDHVFCHLEGPGNYLLDARGARHEDDIFEEYCTETSEFDAINGQEAQDLLEHLMNSGNLATYREDEQQHLENYFNEMRSIGLLTANALVMTTPMIYEDEMYVFEP